MESLCLIIERGIKNQAVDEGITLLYISFFVRQHEPVRAELVIVEIVKRACVGFKVLVVFGDKNVFVGKTASRTKERRLKTLVPVIDDVRDRQIETVAFCSDALGQL